MEPLKYYQATIRYMILLQTKTGKVSYRPKRDEYLINAKSITSALKTLQGLLGAIYDTFEIISIRLSPIQGVINEIEDVLKK